MSAKTPQDRKKKKTGPTSAAAWKSSSGIEEVEVPSGNVALVKRVGPEAFLSSGIVPDTLTPLIDEAVRDKKGLPPAQVAKTLTDDPESLPAMIDMMNRVVAYAVIQPHVETVPDCIAVIKVKKGKTEVEETCGKTVSDKLHAQGNEEGHRFIEGERDPDLLYADEVSLEDRVFIMNYAVGGTRDLARFRSEYGESVARVSDEQGLEDEAE